MIYANVIVSALTAFLSGAHFVQGDALWAGMWAFSSILNAAAAFLHVKLQKV